MPSPFLRALALLCALTAACPCAARPAVGVLLAGDDSLPVFDNAVAAMAAALPPGTRLTRLSTDPGAVQPGIALATLPHVLSAVAALHPAPGQSCFVFATSHGAHHAGLWLSGHDEYLSPAALDRALETGCKRAPTVVVISSCYSGSFARPPMARANRIVLTAARADRSSFGCGAGRTYTVYDQCLLSALAHGGTWRQAYASVQACVRVAGEAGRGGGVAAAGLVRGGSEQASSPFLKKRTKRLLSPRICEKPASSRGTPAAANARR